MARVITAEFLRELYDYDHLTGVFTRKFKNSKVKIGSIAGHIKSNGYVAFHVDRVKVHAHRMAWLHFYGKMPCGDIDHIDGDRTNNRISNLRDVSRQTNLENIKRAKSHNLSTGILGAYKSPKGLFSSRIRISGADHYLGAFKTAELAHAAYMSAKKQFHKGYVA